MEVSVRYEVRGPNGQKYGQSFTDLQAALEYCQQSNVSNDETYHNVVVQSFLPLPIAPEGGQ